MRVADRISHGGHSVPIDKIKNRIPRTLKHIKAAIPLCDYVKILDNSSIEMPFTPLLTIKQGQLDIHVAELPAWAPFLINC